MKKFIKKYEDIITTANLLLAWEEFLTGKRKRNDVILFQGRLMDNIISLHHDLKNKTYKHSNYQAFNISDPKPRNIHKATVRDRLLHHLLYREIYQYFDKQFISDSYSCRLDKGTHRAVYRLAEFANQVSKNNQRTVWVLKCDIKKLFLDLLKDSLVIYSKGKPYYSYSSYLWEIVIQYYKNLKEHNTYSYLRDLEKFIINNSKKPGVNWLRYKFQNLKQEYIEYLGKPKNIADCIKKYNQLKGMMYLDIATKRDLFEFVKKIFETDLRQWVESEGAYRFIIEAGRKQEDLIQKTINSQIENCLLKGGLRKEEISIRRETQLLDNKRTDFLVSYGFVGSILIELKLTTNTELSGFKNRSNYRKKLIQYIQGTDSGYGIFVIFNNDENISYDDFSSILSSVEKIYSNDQYISVIGLNCNK